MLTCRIRARMTEIEHDPNEPPRDTTGTWIYWAAFAVLAVLWIGFLSTDALHWSSFCLGTASGMFLAIWAIAITGNKVPRWMR